VVLVRSTGRAEASGVLRWLELEVEELKRLLEGAEEFWLRRRQRTIVA
jgi:hypothetical protein